MTAVWNVTDELLAAIRSALPGVTVQEGPPAATTPPPAAVVWVDKRRSKFEWRGLGGVPVDRIENMRIALKASAYRSDPDPTVARDAAQAQLRTIVEAIEETVIAGDQTLNGSCTDAKVFRLKAITTAELDGGWTARSKLTISCRNMPGSVLP